MKKVPAKEMKKTKVTPSKVGQDPKKFKQMDTKKSDKKGGKC